MALWRPFEPEVVLDMSRASMKKEHSEEPALVPFYSGHVHHHYTSCPPASPPSGLEDDPEYLIFERNALEDLAAKNGGSLLGQNPNMRRAVKQTNGIDDTYRRQREKNNHAAKQSRDRRKLREMRLSLQVTFLKKRIASMRARLAAGLCGRCRQPCEC